MSKKDREEETDYGCLALADKKTQLRRPRPWCVFLLNDDYTTMDFVVKVLRSVFGRSLEEAEAIMMKVHREGRGLAGVYPLDIAESLAAETMQKARAAGFPLRCEVKIQGGK
ncbi:ATP-dependent Clp protease adaptor ClpS [Mesosutterella sp. OilRF-GAM-744-9]|uniref:ATP-dependent Clp protease adapter protein ClpS n=1 Tax=Mesosutterella porci TaxID=2915351 RepID=A0ABS9MT13_9BURK|nr:ATP-dependent Clp protease adaptor ClpS [Mesosutterella sp. oilRF-744-WT-GAM-9]MCG5031761.1 ATP-dependent Clp protease adaptor ClpS [Mesosutterella sp. oilRF-744-WT-GAM-9]MCI6531190.1 ATP-dependent Clp protease adaptor ClpS [Mesosutterella sp.]